MKQTKAIFLASKILLLAVLGFAGADHARAEGVTYFVNVLTSDAKNANTDDDVYISLYGDSGGSFRAELDSDGDDFERGKWGYYQISHNKDIGRITHVRLEMKGEDGWRPEMVYVLGPSDEKYPHWRRERAGDADPTGALLDFYRFDPRPVELDEGGVTSITIALDERGQKDLGKTLTADNSVSSTGRGEWIYYVDVLTEGYNDSGTDADVKIEIVGEYGIGNSVIQLLDNEGHDDFQIGQIDSFKIVTDKYLGRIERVRLTLNSPGISSLTRDWDGEALEFSWIKIYAPPHPTSNDWPKAVPGHSDAKGKKHDLYVLLRSSPRRIAIDDPPGEYYKGGDITLDVDRDNRHKWSEDGFMNSLDTGYFINVLTSDRKDAGTDSDVFITLYGSSGKSLRVELDNASGLSEKIEGNDFRRGEWDYYKFKSEDLGRITTIELELVGDDAWRPKMIYVLGPRHSLFPEWRREGAGHVRDASGERYDFYRFDPKEAELDAGGTTSLVLHLDDEGKRALGQVSEEQLRDWSPDSKKWVFIKSFRCVSTARGIGDAARVAGLIGGFAAQGAIESIPYAGETIGPVVVEVVQATTRSEDWGGVGVKVVEGIDSVTAGADDFYFKVNGEDVKIGKDGGLYREMNKGDLLPVDYIAHLSGPVKVEMMEWDTLTNDSLGGLAFNPNMSVTTVKGGHHAVVTHKDEGSSYIINYYIVESAVKPGMIEIVDGEAVVR